MKDTMFSKNPKQNKQFRILAIGAHLDDIELACGGTLAKAISNGHTVEMLVASDSTGSLHDGRKNRTRRMAMDEGACAAREIGVNELEILEFADKSIPYDSTMIEAIEKRIISLEPDIILTHWPFDTHQDHRNVALATISAARYHNTILMYEPITPSGRSYVGFRPQLYVNITGFMDRKTRSLRAHESQYLKYGKNWLEAVKARARHRGYEIGVNFAETFEVMRFELKL